MLDLSLFSFISLTVSRLHSGETKLYISLSLSPWEPPRTGNNSGGGEEILAFYVKVAGSMRGSRTYRGQFIARQGFSYYYERPHRPHTIQTILYTYDVTYYPGSSFIQNHPTML